LPIVCACDYFAQNVQNVFDDGQDVWFYPGQSKPNTPHHTNMTTTAQAKQKLKFKCCNLEAFGLRQVQLIEGIQWRTAKCPHCGHIVQLSIYEKPCLPV